MGESGDREERLEECHGHCVGSGDLRDVLLNAVIRGAVEDLSLPHVVVCRDQTSGFTSYAGPYESGWVALCAAEREFQQVLASDWSHVPFEFGVAPLFRPTPA